MACGGEKKRKIDDTFQDDSGINDAFTKKQKPAKKYNEWRSTVRSASVFSDSIRVSLQTCKTVHSRKVLLAWQNSTQDKVLKRRIEGLLEVLETLQLPSTHCLQSDIQETEKGFPGIKHGGLLGFEDAFELYVDHTAIDECVSTNQREDSLKSQFILDLLYDRYGDRCVVLSIGKKRVTILDNDEVNIPTVLSQIAEHFQELTDKKN